jgi:DNA-directed RNA polymerase subunit RPC12/RpoP
MTGAADTPYVAEATRTILEDVVRLFDEHAYRPRGNTREAPGLEAACACGRWASPVATFNGAHVHHRRHVADVLLEVGLLSDVRCHHCGGSGISPTLPRTIDLSATLDPSVRCPRCSGWGLQLRWIPGFGEGG